MLRGVSFLGILLSSTRALQLRMISRDTVATFTERTLEVNKSKFIARVYPIESTEAALDHVAENQKSDPKASHWCWAFSHNGVTRSSDDGEPSGTAGRPILSAIEGEELDSVAVVVTRYYGGTKLGTGGLVRAYGGSAREALRACERVVRVEHSQIAITLPPESIATVYRIIGGMEQHLAGESFTRLSEEYSADGRSATITWSVPHYTIDDISASLTEATKGASTVDIRED